MTTGDDYRVVTKNSKSTLVIHASKRDDFGQYICKAINDAGECSTKAKLVESSASSIMPQEELDEIIKTKLEKKLAQKSVSKRKMSKEKSQFLTATSATETFSNMQMSSVTSSFKITTKEDIFVQEIQGSIVKEVEHTTIKKTFDVSDIHNIKTSAEVENMLDSINTAKFGAAQDSLRELATIGHLIKNGLSIKDVNSLYQTNSFPALQSPESQSALVQLLEREGHGKLVSEVLTEETEVDEKYVETAGFRAFMKMIEKKQSSVEEIMFLLSPDDFVSHEWKEELNHGDKI